MSHSATNACTSTSSRPAYCVSADLQDAFALNVTMSNNAEDSFDPITEDEVKAVYATRRRVLTLDDLSPVDTSPSPPEVLPIFRALAQEDASIDPNAAREPLNTTTSLNTDTNPGLPANDSPANNDSEGSPPHLRWPLGLAADGIAAHATCN
ncbi:hypothetical protein AURDEDRAFT_115966 [Auricularia subglabra TFB-10046 SS5]|uniref:Uncharacterized protein n=1 Tax=Auricularia subglabra (strain TFB-10046 / SS5) TaxID=717982 RepID=J0D228_AURST|nr:hypothetical protein AURDEDRAFT_115966 [Auricularia subglabra TFB-10046 SS5]